MAAVDTTLARPRFGGVFWRLARATTGLMLPFAGHHWNPVFAVIEHRGRQTGRTYAAPVAARRVDGGFVVSLAFGAQVAWHRNLLAAGGGMVRYQGASHAVRGPERLPAELARPAFHPIQRAALGAVGVEAYVLLPDA
jgi:deazaflavin-dependent oxidoreductase (nitroreductase family)